MNSATASVLGCWLETGLHHSSIVCCWWMNEWLLNYASFVVYQHIDSYQQPAAKPLFTDHWHCSSRRHRRAMPMDCNWLRQIWDTVGDNFHTMSFPFSVKCQCHVLLFQVRYFDHRWQALYNYINAIKRRPLWMKTKVNPSRPARRISRAYPKRPIGYFRSRYHNDGISQRWRTCSEFWHSRRIIITALRYAERALS